jgi:hypothetical protein
MGARHHAPQPFHDCLLISADQALNTAAIAEGLTVDDPNSHP